MPPNLHNFCAFFQCFSVFCSVLVQHSLTWEMETRPGSSSSSSGIVKYIYHSWYGVVWGWMALYCKYCWVHKGLGINANGSSMTDFHMEIIFFIKFFFANIFLYGFYPKKMFYFLSMLFLGGVKTTSTSHPSR